MKHAATQRQRGTALLLAMVILTLVAIYLVSWLTYRASKRLVSPVIWLARQVQAWDPRRPDVDARRIALVGHSEGGLIAPMFNDWVEGRRAEVGGWTPTPWRRSRQMGWPVPRS